MGVPAAVGAAALGAEAVDGAGGFGAGGVCGRASRANANTDVVARNMRPQVAAAWVGGDAIGAPGGGVGQRRTSSGDAIMPCASPDERHAPCAVCVRICGSAGSNSGIGTRRSCIVTDDVYDYDPVAEHENDMMMAGGKA